MPSWVIMERNLSVLYILLLNLIFHFAQVGWSVLFKGFDSVQLLRQVLFFFSYKWQPVGMCCSEVILNDLLRENEIIKKVIENLDCSTLTVKDEYRSHLLFVRVERSFMCCSIPDLCLMKCKGQSEIILEVSYYFKCFRISAVTICFYIGEKCKMGRKDFSVWVTFIIWTHLKK